MKEKILFIAGGSWQKPFVKYLKDKGHFVAIVNPVVTETTQLADLHVVADVNDLDEINKHIQKIKPSIITSDQSDISTLIVATLSEKWNLPGNNVQTIQKFTNKFEIYKFAKSIGIPVPETKIVNSTKDIQEFGEIYGFPLIIKPTDATYSRGFRKIDSPNEIKEELIIESLKFSKLKQIITQTYIPGNMVTLEGACSNGKHKTVATSKKDQYFKPGITSEVQYPSNLNEINKIIEANDLYVEKSGMKFGLTHSEYIYNQNGFKLIEIGARGGGAGIIDKIVPWVSGIDVYDILYKSLIGEIVDVKKLIPLQRHALLKYYNRNEMENCNQEKINKLIQNISGIAEFQFDFAGKQYVNDKNDNRHTMAIYLANSMENVNEISEKVQEIIKQSKI